MIGIIGGTGLDDPKLLKGFREKKIKTIYGMPSSAYTIGKINGVEVAILSRHGKTHSINPSNINYRANILGFKELGIKAIVASSACGSLRKEITPGTLVLANQVIDRTTKRENTFYDREKVCHISMAEPFCHELREILGNAMNKAGIKFHENKTLVTIEGPRFSSRAESKMFRQWGADIINMTSMPEAVLAREQGIHYQPVNIVTDYDCIIESEGIVNAGMIVKRMKESAEKFRKIIIESVKEIDSREFACECEKEIKKAMI